MAIKIGKKSEEVSFKLYSGVGAVNVLAVNPNKEKIASITGRTLEDEPSYTGKLEDGTPYTRVVFYVKTDNSCKVNNNIELSTQISFMITKATIVGKESGKTKVIDKYGRTAWANPQELASHSIPQYSNGPANISADYRPVYKGEEDLINFLIAWLNIPSPMTYNSETRKWSDKPNIEDSEISLDIPSLLKGDVSEFKEVIPAASDFAVKCTFGVRSTDEGKQYQAVYTRMFLKNSETRFERLDKSIQEAKNAGAFPNVEFSIDTLHEYKVESTNFSESDPLEADSAPKSPWDNWEQ